MVKKINPKKIAKKPITKKPITKRKRVVKEQDNEKQRQTINIKIDQSKKTHPKPIAPAPVKQQVPQSLNLSMPSYLPQQQQPANAQNLNTMIAEMSKLFERKKEAQKQEPPARQPLPQPAPQPAPAPQPVAEQPKPIYEEITSDWLKEYNEQNKIFGQFKLTPVEKPSFESSSSSQTLEDFNNAVIDETAQPYIAPKQQEKEEKQKSSSSSSSSSSTIEEPGFEMAKEANYEDTGIFYNLKNGTKYTIYRKPDSKQLFYLNHKGNYTNIGSLKIKDNELSKIKKQIEDLRADNKDMDV